MNRSRSAELFARARRVIPGGVNSPVRAFRAVGGQPVFIDHGAGSYLYDVDGNQYIDYVGSWGPLIFGHADEETVEAVRDAALRGTTFYVPGGMGYEKKVAERLDWWARQKQEQEET